jgi:hypothetical protein
VGIIRKPEDASIACKEQIGLMPEAKAEKYDGALIAVQLLVLQSLQTLGISAAVRFDAAHSAAKSLSAAAH